MEKAEKRIIYPDLLRIAAIFFVIIVHEVGGGWRNMDPASFNWNVVNAFNSLSRFCVPVFIMISGSFMLDSNREYTLKKLYTHNILRIVTSFVFWSAAYAVLVKLADYKTINADILSEMAVAFFKGHYHLWFLFTITFLYMITPFLRKICEDKKLEEYFLILCALPLIYNFILIFDFSETVKTMIDNSNVYFILGYSGYFVLGHYLTKYETPKKVRIAIYILGLSAVAVSALIARYKVLGGLDRETDESLYSYLLPTTALTASAVFLIFKYGVSKIRFGAKSSKFVSGLAKLCFGIYLSHVFVNILFYSVGIRMADYPVLLYIPVMAIVTFAISAVITFVISKIPVLNKYII